MRSRDRLGNSFVAEASSLATTYDDEDESKKRILLETKASCATASLEIGETLSSQADEGKVRCCRETKKEGQHVREYVLERERRGRLYTRGCGGENQMNK